MRWPELQLEHLAAALVGNWLALAWFFWGRGQKLGAEVPRRDPTWNWLAGAALLGGVQLIVWVALTESRLAYWPVWAEPMLQGFSASRGAAAGLAAAAWSGNGVSRSRGWVALIAAAFACAWLPHLGVILCSAGWLAMAILFLLPDRSRPSRPGRIAIGVALLGLAASEAGTPDLTSLILRLPSEHPPQWGSREFASLALKAFSCLVAGLTLWFADRPPRRVYPVLSLALIASLIALSWRDARAHSAARAALWLQLESFATTLAPQVAAIPAPSLRARADEDAALVAELAALERIALPPLHLWLWQVREGTVIHLADSAGVASLPKTPVTPRGYRLPQLPNLPLHSIRGERFESGSFFVADEQRMALHVPVRHPKTGAPIAWLQASLALTDWERQISDPRVPTAIGLLYLAGLTALVLAGRTWIAASHRLHEQAVAAAAGARAKNEMAGLVSHELRTPLQVVLGHLEMLQSAPLLPDTRHTMQIIEGQCRQLLGLVNDTLDLCALETGCLPHRTMRFSPADLAMAVVRDLRPLADERRLALELELNPALPPLVEADAARLRQVLTNLLANAIKYTAAGGARLAAGVEAGADSRLRFVVSDTGPGIPGAVLANLGQPFQSGQSGHGTGLGLALVCRLCTHLRGEFFLQNSPAGGCEATVFVPVTVSAPEAPSFAADASQGVATALTGTRIVLAEDNTLVRELIVAYLRGLGAEVEAVSDGAAALAACRTRVPDALILDLAMPGMDGRSAARAVRESHGGAPKLIVGLSAETLSETEAEAAGFDRFFVKPVSLAKLAAVFAPHHNETPFPIVQSEGRLRHMFRNEAPGQLAALHSAVERHDLTAVVQLAHYLQGSAYALSDEPLRTACTELRRWAEHHADFVDAGPFLGAIDREIHRLLGMVT